MSQLKIKGILSFPNLFTPRAVQQGDEPKYSASILVRKDDPQVAMIQNTIDTDKLNGWPSGAPATLKVCMNDGLVKHPDDPKMHNYMIINASSNGNSKPHVVDAALQPIMDQSQAYPGCMALFAVNTFVYNKQLSKGVAAGLNGVMILGEEGELGRLDNKPTVDQMFGAPTQPVAPAAPVAPVAPVAPAPVAPVAPAPVAPVAPAPVAPVAPAPVVPFMTAAANGVTYQAYKDAGWTDDNLVSGGLAVF